MNKEEYMKLLKKHLRRLPKQDFNKAVEYFEEYFEDAGEGQERQAIEDLGNPQEAADQIIRDFAIENSQKPIKGMRRGMNAVWVGVLAVFAAPVALPLLLCLAVVILCVVLVLVMLFFSFILVGVVLVIISPVLVVAGFTVLTRSIPDFLSCLGYGIFAGGLGVLLTYSMVGLCGKFLNGIVRLFGRMVKKGGK